MSLQRHCLVASRRGLKPAVVLNALPQVPKPTGDCTNIPALPTESIRLPPPAAVTTLAASPVVQPVLEAGPQQVQSAPLPPARIAPCCLSIVTGASRGLGAAIARVLVMRGPPLPASRAVEAINKTHADHSAAADGTSSSNGGSSGASKAVSPSPCAALGLTHDLILLASDSGRLSQFVRTELAPLLEQQQQPQPQHAGEHKHYRNHPPAPSPLQLAIVATRGNTDERPPSSSSAEAVISVAQAHTEPSKPPSHFTRVHTACFDLGDLELLEEHVSQLLMAAPGSATSLSRSTGEPVALELETSPATSAAAVKAAGAPVTAMTRSDAATSLKATSIISDHYGGSDCSGGAGRGSGLLPLPLSAYTHVLLVHNAGQVGDLVPLELQNLANIRRQTDLNVTSFTHLTAAVLRSFLNAPVEPASAQSSGGSSEGAAQSAQPVGPQDHQPGAERTRGSRAPEEGRRADIHAPQPGTLGTEVSGTCGDSTAPHCADTPAASVRATAAIHPLQESQQRRVITFVNISSVSVDQPYEHFSLYGMGKAARHMIIRSIAHEAALREEELAAVAVAAEEEKGPKAGRQGTAPLPSATSSLCQGSLESGTIRNQPAAVARVRALSYAPGAINTEMQAAAREALPAGPLKARFEDNARCGRLVDPWASAQALYDILTADVYGNGAHLDYYSSGAGSGGDAESASHPLARS